MTFRRSELETASCIHDNEYIPVRCTQTIDKSYVPVKRTLKIDNNYVPVRTTKVDEKMKDQQKKKPAAANKSKWWCLLRGSICFLSNLKSNTKTCSPSPPPWAWRRVF